MAFLTILHIKWLESAYFPAIIYLLYVTCACGGKHFGNLRENSTTIPPVTAIIRGVSGRAER